MDSIDPKEHLDPSSIPASESIVPEQDKPKEQLSPDEQKRLAFIAKVIALEFHEWCRLKGLEHQVNQKYIESCVAATFKLLPDGWNPTKPLASHYKQRFAQDAQQILDILATSPEKQLVWKCDKVGISISSLYQRWYWGSKYLCDHMDPLGSYTKLKEHTKVLRNNVGPDAGLYFSVRKNPNDVDQQLNLQEIKDELVAEVEKFILDANVGQMKSWKNLVLTEEQKVMIENLLAQVPDFKYLMDKGTLMIKRIKVEEL